VNRTQIANPPRLVLKRSMLTSGHLDVPGKEVCSEMNWSSLIVPRDGLRRTASTLRKRFIDIPAGHQAIAWILLALIVVVTLGPINLRPTTPFGPDFERFAAFVVVAGVFSLTYPKRLIYVAALIVVSCGLFEYAQHFVAGRHADIGNFLIKIAGAAVGMIGGTSIR
jgi:hypothetical protein